MPDTAVLRTAQGWIDRDAPATAYKVRWQARKARREARKAERNAARSLAGSSNTTTWTAAVFTSGPVCTTSTATTLTGLQAKLFDRLTTQQGVNSADAMDVILNSGYGYNQAASYGHMRAVGASHAEAKSVIDLCSPHLSLLYGQSRATGRNHPEAVLYALRNDQGDDDSD